MLCSVFFVPVRTVIVVRVGVFFFVVICFDVVETSYEGHMVDALASRADEGRRSLR